MKSSWNVVHEQRRLTAIRLYEEARAHTAREREGGGEREKKRGGGRKEPTIWFKNNLVQFDLLLFLFVFACFSPVFMVISFKIPLREPKF